MDVKPHTATTNKNHHTQPVSHNAAALEAPPVGCCPPAQDPKQIKHLGGNRFTLSVPRINVSSSQAMRRQADQILVVSRFKFTRDETLEANVGTRQ